MNDVLEEHFLSEEVLLKLILTYIEQDCGRLYEYIVENGRRRRISRTLCDVNDSDDIWRTPWGVMLSDASLRDNTSYASGKFRKRFRVSHAMFLYLVQRCVDAELFPGVKIPIEFRLLITLRILGRGNCADDIAEFSGFSDNTINYIFHQMTEKFVDAFYDEFISFPSGDELQKVQESYAEMGFPGACGSMDATHVRLAKCPHGLRVL